MDKSKKPNGSAHILWNIVADNDTFQQLKKSWTDVNDRLNDKRRDKKRPGESSFLPVDDGRLSKRKLAFRGDSSAYSIGMVPWTNSKLYSNDIIGLHEEIIDLYHWLCPRHWEIRLRCDIVHQIKKVVREVWPCAKVRVFGSTRTKLFLPTSDLDIVVSGFEPDVEWDSATDPSHPTAVELLVVLRQALIARKVTDEAHSVVIDKASVPIVKLTELRTKLSVDITFSAASSINAVKFVNDWQTRCFHTLRPLAFVLKQFIAHRELNEVFHGGLSSYGLLLMLINFLQLHERGQDALSCNSNLGVLLLEFLELYGINFNYRSVGIDPTGAGSRFARRDGDYDNPQQQHLLSVIDPFNKDNDVTRGSFAFEKVQAAFHFAYCELEALIRPSSLSNSEKTLVPSILSSVMQVHPETVFHRVWAERAFANLVNSYGSECDDRPMDWVSSDASSDEGCTDSFEHDEDSKEGCPPSRNSAPTGPSSECGTSQVGDNESSLSNYGDDMDDKSSSTSPSLFVKLHSGLPNHPQVQNRNLHHPSLSHHHHHQPPPHVHHPVPTHLIHHGGHGGHPALHTETADHEKCAEQRRIHDLHRSISMPPFHPHVDPKMIPMANTYLAPQIQQELKNILSSAPRAVVLPGGPMPFVIPQKSTASPSSRNQTEPSQNTQNQSVQVQVSSQTQSQQSNHYGSLRGNNWSSNNNRNPQWNNQGRRGAAAGNVSESSSTGIPNDQTSQSSSHSGGNHPHHSSNHIHHNPQLPRRYQQHQQQLQMNNQMQRRGGDRFGRMHGYSTYNHNGQHYNNMQHQQNNNQRMNSFGNNGNFRNAQNRSGVVSQNHGNNMNNSRGNQYVRVSQSQQYQQTEPIIPSSLGDLDNSNCSEAAFDPSEVLSMKIDRERKANKPQRSGRQSATGDKQVINSIGDHLSSSEMLPFELSVPTSSLKSESDVSADSK